MIFTDYHVTVPQHHKNTVHVSESLERDMDALIFFSTEIFPEMPSGITSVIYALCFVTGCLGLSLDANILKCIDLAVSKPIYCDKNVYCIVVIDIEGTRTSKV